MNCKVELKSVIFDTEDAAGKCLYVMKEQLEKYGRLTVADYYDIVGILPHISDTKWQWTNFDGVFVQRAVYYRKKIVSEKVNTYFLNLPEPERAE